MSARSRSSLRWTARRNTTRSCRPPIRRPFGFDWQDWGAQDALEVLADARRRFTIDTNRIWLAGHSMGGHGTWSVGIHHPGSFAALAPSAGWTTLPLYIPWVFQRSMT